MVPDIVVEAIKKRGLFGCTQSGRAS
jgi:hypothetical protein